MTIAAKFELMNTLEQYTINYNDRTTTYYGYLDEAMKYANRFIANNITIEWDGVVVASRYYNEQLDDYSEWGLAKYN